MQTQNHFWHLVVGVPGFHDVGTIFALESNELNLHPNHHMLVVHGLR